jgi:hypothetical protein
VHLSAGWNLVGPSAPAGETTYQGFLLGTTAATTPLLIDPNAADPVAVADPPADASHQVLDGYAYWLYSVGEGALTGQILSGPPTP